MAEFNNQYNIYEPDSILFFIFSANVYERDLNELDLEFKNNICEVINTNESY